MECKKCGHNYHRVLNKRLFKTFNSRVLQCIKCGFMWSSKETWDENVNHPGYNKTIENQIDLFEDENLSNKNCEKKE